MALPELVEHGKRGGGSTRGEDAEGERGRGATGSGRALRRTGAGEQGQVGWAGVRGTGDANGMGHGGLFSKLFNNEYAKRLDSSENLMGRICFEILIQEV